jgi:hypothetical protein
MCRKISVAIVGGGAALPTINLSVRSSKSVERKGWQSRPKVFFADATDAGTEEKRGASSCTRAGRVPYVRTQWFVRILIQDRKLYTHSTRLSTPHRTAVEPRFGSQCFRLLGRRNWAWRYERWSKNPGVARLQPNPKGGVHPLAFASSFHAREGDRPPLRKHCNRATPPRKLRENHHLSVDGSPKRLHRFTHRSRKDAFLLLERHPYRRFRSQGCSRVATACATPLQSQGG